MSHQFAAFLAGLLAGGVVALLGVWTAILVIRARDRRRRRP